MPGHVKPHTASIVRHSRGLLLDWLNIEDPNELLRRHSEIFRELRQYEKERDRLHRYIADVRSSLQDAWEAKGKHDPDWFLHNARRVYREAELIAVHGTIVEGFPSLSPPERDEPFHRAILQLFPTKAVQRLSKCVLKGCPAPYFIRRKPRKQPYCGTTCRADGYRKNKTESKRRERAK